MNAERLGRVARLLRVRQRLTQVALATRAGVSRRAVSQLERGDARSLRVGILEAIIVALGGRLDIRLLWNGSVLDRMLDEAHAVLGTAVKKRLERWGWMVEVEVSYSQYGERGRIDLLAWHPGLRILLVIELKSDLVDVQALLGSLDAKVRLAPTVARRFGWVPVAVVPVIVFTEDRTTRNRLARVDALFDRFTVRGRAAQSWTRHPGPAPTGLLWFTDAGAAVPSRSDAPRARPSRPAAST